MPRPEPTTGTVSGNVYFSDGVTLLTVDSIAQIVSKADGSVCLENSVINGVFNLEVPAGDFVLKIINSEIEIGSIEITINVGTALEDQNVTTNKEIERVLNLIQKVSF